MIKCAFFKSQIHYLGHLLSQNGISHLPENLDVISTMPSPQNIKELTQFLGLKGYYRNCINHCTYITNSVTKLLKKDEPYIWRETHKNFHNLKTAYNHPQFQSIKTHTFYSQMQPYGNKNLPLSLTVYKTSNQ